MGGLVDYGSSGEESVHSDSNQATQPGAEPTTSKESSTPSDKEKLHVTADTAPKLSRVESPPISTVPLSKDAQPVQLSDVPAGPAPGPAPGPAIPSQLGSEVIQETELSYEETREKIRSLTMPPAPNFNIPPSPPGTPPPKTTKQFRHFLEIKKTKGIHFNKKFANSDVLRNPALMHKLNEIKNISDQDTYASALPDDLAVITRFPKAAYAQQLNQRQVEQWRKEERRERPRQMPEFVPEKGIWTKQGEDRARQRKAGLEKRKDLSIRPVENNQSLGGQKRGRSSSPPGKGLGSM